MFFFTPPSLIQKLSNNFLHWKIKTLDKKVFLSFDDGPTPGLTKEILSYLNQYNARATFFCTGKKARENPDLIQKILENNHCLGNHTYHHLDGWRCSTNKYVKDVMQCDQVFHSSLFRPPYGRITPAQIKQLKKKFDIIMWSLMSYDYHPRMSPERSLKKLNSITDNGSIILMHDSLNAKHNLKYILPALIENLAIKGYKFERLDQEFLYEEDNQSPK